VRWSLVTLRGFKPSPPGEKKTPPQQPARAAAVPCARQSAGRREKTEVLWLPRRFRSHKCLSDPQDFGPEVVRVDRAISEGKSLTKDAAFVGGSVWWGQMVVRTDATSCHSNEGLTSPSRCDRHHAGANKLQMRVNCAVLPAEGDVHHSTTPTMMHFNLSLHVCSATQRATTSLEERGNSQLYTVYCAPNQESKAILSAQAAEVAKFDDFHALCARPPKNTDATADARIDRISS
jgi:hypothetical protein